MKVAYVTMHFPAPTEPFAGTDVRTLLSLGVEVDVYTLMPANERHHQLLRERDLGRVHVRTMSVPRVLRGIGSIFLKAPSAIRMVGSIVAHNWRRPTHVLKSLILLPAAMTIAADLEEEEHDVVHLFWGHFPALVGLLAIRSPRQPLLSMFLGAYDLGSEFGSSGQLARCADLVVTHAQVNVETIARLGVARDRIRVVYRGVPEAVLERGPESMAPARDRFGLLTAARLIAPKRIDEVIAVFAAVAPRWPAATLTVLGDGPERQRLSDLVTQLGLADRVRFLGHLRQDEVFAHMRRASAFVLLSTKEDERLPNVVKEAMVCGCVPVVAFTPGMDELVEDGVSGFVVPARGVEEAAARVEQVFLEGPEIQGLRENGRLRIEKLFDARKNMGAYVAAWAEAGERRATEPARPEAVNVRQGI